MVTITPSSLVPLGWIVHLIACYYLVRPLRNTFYRSLLTILPCAILIFVGCHDLPYFHMSSVMAISLYWLVTIRLIHLIILSPNEVQSIRSYAWKFLWFFIPIVPCQSKNSIGFYLLSACIKLFLSHWVYQWMRSCPPNDSYGRIGLFYLFICAGTVEYDLQIVFIRLITCNKYSVLEFNDYPFFSKSIREFWGRRYNRLVGTLLKESIFDPIRRLPNSSSAIGALAGFLISGLLHAHVATGAFGASSPLPSFLFFLLQGIACCVEVMCPFALPKPIGIVLTHVFLLLTAPLYVGLFTRAGAEYYQANQPILFDSAWLPKLPVPHYCPT